MLNSLKRIEREICCSTYKCREESWLCASANSFSFRFTLTSYVGCRCDAESKTEAQKDQVAHPRSHIQRWQNQDFTDSQAHNTKWDNSTINNWHQWFGPLYILLPLPPHLLDVSAKTSPSLGRLLFNPQFIVLSCATKAHCPPHIVILTASITVFQSIYSLWCPVRIGAFLDWFPQQSSHYTEGALLIFVDCWGPGSI